MTRRVGNARITALAVVGLPLAVTAFADPASAQVDDAGGESSRAGLSDEETAADYAEAAEEISPDELQWGAATSSLGEGFETVPIESKTAPVELPSETAIEVVGESFLDSDAAGDGDENVDDGQDEEDPLGKTNEDPGATLQLRDDASKEASSGIAVTTRVAGLDEATWKPFDIYTEGVDTILAADLVGSDLRVGVEDGQVELNEAFAAPQGWVSRSLTADGEELAFERVTTGPFDPITEKLVVNEGGVESHVSTQEGTRTESVSATSFGDVELQVHSSDLTDTKKVSSSVRHWAADSQVLFQQKRTSEALKEGSRAEVDSRIEADADLGLIQLIQRSTIDENGTPFVVEHALSFDGHEVTSKRTVDGQKSKVPQGFPAELMVPWPHNNKEAHSVDGSMQVKQLLHPDLDPLQVVREYVFRERKPGGRVFSVDVVEKKGGEIFQTYRLLVEPSLSKAQITYLGENRRLAGRVLSRPGLSEINIGGPSESNPKLNRNVGDTGLGSQQGFTTGVTVSASSHQTQSVPTRLALQRKTTHDSSFVSTTRSDGVTYMPRSGLTELSVADELPEFNFKNNLNIELSPRTGLSVASEVANSRNGLIEHLNTQFRQDSVSGFELSDVDHEAEVRLTNFEEAALKYLQQNPGKTVLRGEWKGHIGRNWPGWSDSDLGNKVKTINSLLPPHEPAFLFGGIDGSGLFYPDKSKPVLAITDGLRFDSGFRALRTDDRLIPLNQTEGSLLARLLGPDGGNINERVPTAEFGELVTEGTSPVWLTQAVFNNVRELDQKMTNAGFPGHLERNEDWVLLRDWVDRTSVISAGGVELRRLPGLESEGEAWVGAEAVGLNALQTEVVEHLMNHPGEAVSFADFRNAGVELTAHTAKVLVKKFDDVNALVAEGQPAFWLPSKNPTTFHFRDGSVAAVPLNGQVSYEPGYRALRIADGLVHLTRAESVILDRLVNDDEIAFGDRVHQSDFPAMLTQQSEAAQPQFVISRTVRRAVPDLKRKLGEHGVPLEYKDSSLRLAGFNGLISESGLELRKPTTDGGKSRIQIGSNQRPLTGLQTEIVEYLLNNPGRAISWRELEGAGITHLSPKSRKYLLEAFSEVNSWVSAEEPIFWLPNDSSTTYLLRDPSKAPVRLGDDVLFEPGYQALRTGGGLVHLSQQEAAILTRMTSPGSAKPGVWVDQNDIPQLLKPGTAPKRPKTVISRKVELHAPRLQEKLQKVGVVLEYREGRLRLVK